MSETFGKRLKRFALSVDIVDEHIFREAWDLIRQYLTDQLNPTYWALLIASPVNNRPGLLAKECSIGNKPSFSLKNEQGKHTCLAAYSFDMQKPLWLVSSDKGPVNSQKSIKDSWSNEMDLPHFEKPFASDIKTVALVPLSHKGQYVGLLDLQSPDYTEFTKRIKTELQLLAETLSVLLVLTETNLAQRKDTIEAINQNKLALKDESWPQLTKPKIFIASSDKADDKVMGTIRSVLHEFSDRMDVIYWKESSSSGNINWEILKHVKESQFGLCYFSEPVQDPIDGYRFQDNLNVIFEAGMFQSLTNPDVTDHPVGWIPIREQVPLTPPPPFDFAQQRMIVVERVTEDKTPNQEKLKSSLRDRINDLLR